MTARERRDASLEFARRSDYAFAHGGNSMIAIELLRGAVAQAIFGIAEMRKWPCHGHGGYPRCYRSQLDAQNLFPLQVFKNPVRHSALQPAVQHSVAGTPVAEPGGNARQLQP